MSGGDFARGALAQRTAISDRYRKRAEALKARGAPDARRHAAFLILLAAEIRNMPLATSGEDAAG